MFEYFREKVSNNGNIFLQETHSSEDALNKLQDDFQGQILFSHGTLNSCGVMIGFLGNKKNKCNKIKTDNNGRIIVLEPEIDDWSISGEYIILFQNAIPLEKIIFQDIQRCLDYIFISSTLQE